MIILAAVLDVSIRVLGVSPIAVLLLLAMFARVMPRVMTCHQLYQECMHARPAFENITALAARCAAAAEPADSPAETLEFRNSLRMESISFSYRAYQRSRRLPDSLDDYGRSVTVSITLATTRGSRRRCTISTSALRWAR